jgi:hypothetical protein
MFRGNQGSGENLHGYRQETLVFTGKPGVYRKPRCVQESLVGTEKPGVHRKAWCSHECLLHTGNPGAYKETKHGGYRGVHPTVYRKPLWIIMR